MVAVLLTNGDFSNLNAKGRPVDWSADWTHWSVAKGVAKDGANALVWTNADPNVRVTAMQPIRLEHGKMYSLDYDIRIDGRLCGDAKGGASAYVEYYGENGKWLSGTYGDVYKKTDDAWIHVCKISGEIPTNAVSYRVGLTANKGLTGRASFANVCVREFELPAAWDPVKARYRYADGQTHGRRVWIDLERRCIVDGKPFFPLGVYGGGGHMELIGKSPFNTLMLYGAPDRAKLDEARRNGLMIISGVNHFPLTPEGDATLAEYVRSVKDHPALLAWYAFDEAPITEVPRWEKRRDLLEKLDDDHPVWGVMNHPTWTGQQLGMFDVGGADPYPVPNEPLEQCTSWTENVVRRTGRRRAVWMVPQAFNWANYDRPFGRVPTREELRTMTRLCLDAGATGIIYFKFGDLLNNAKSPSTTFESRWADLVAVAEEVRVRLMAYKLGFAQCPVKAATQDVVDRGMTARMREVMDHPALLAWYLADEWPVTERDLLIHRYGLARRTDPDHPAYAVQFQFDQIPEYRATCDVIGTDPYPIPDPKDGSLCLLVVNETRELRKADLRLPQVCKVFRHPLDSVPTRLDCNRLHLELPVMGVAFLALNP